MSPQRNTGTGRSPPRWRALALILAAGVLGSTTWFALKQQPDTHPDHVPTLWSREGLRHAWSQPIERNAWLRLPRARVPSSDALLGVSTSAEGARAWVTTTSGLMFRSEDTGMSWTLLPASLPARPTRAPVFLADGSGWIIANRSLWKTSDGGRTWSPEPLGLIQGNMKEVPLALWGQKHAVLCLTNRRVLILDGVGLAPARGLWVSDLMPEVDDGSSLLAATADLSRVLLLDSRGIRLLGPTRFPPWEMGMSLETGELAQPDPVPFLSPGIPGLEVHGIRVTDDGRFVILARQGIAAVDPVEAKWRWAGPYPFDYDRGGRALVSHWWWSWTDGVMQAQERHLPSRLLPLEQPTLRTTMPVAPQEDTSWAVSLALLGEQRTPFGIAPGSTVLRKQSDRGWERALVIQESFARPAVDTRGHIWVGSSSGVLLRSRDQGSSWDTEVVLGKGIEAVWFTPDGGPGYVQAGGEVFSFDPAAARASLRELSTPVALPIPTAPGCEDGSCRELSLVEGQGWAIRQSVGAQAQQEVEPGEEIVFTRGDGTWTSQRLPERIDTLLAVGNGVGLAFSKQGTIFRTSNWGRTWERMEHATYPALWYYLVAWPVVLVLVGLSSRRPRPVPTEVPLGSRLTSDRPLQGNADDVLGLHELAQGLSRFLRNDQTEPSLTIAVTGRWGSGKSSLLNLLESDLASYGLRPIRFNAWHHEQQGTPVASLYDAIIRSGIPPLVSLDGLKFRAGLLLKRGQRYRVKLIGSLLVFLFACTYFRFSPEQFADSLGVVTATLARLVQALGTSDFESYASGRAASPLPDSVEQWFAVLVAVFSLVNVVRTLLGRVQAFGVAPEKLLSALHGSTKGADSREAVGFQSRFGEDLRAVTGALPYPLVILVDDLDRCTPANTLKMLEAINFLTSSGDCFVVMAVSSEVLRAYVRVVLKDVPQEEEGPEGRKRDTADVYLEKLINLEVKVPTMTEDHAVRLANPGLEDKNWQDRRDALQSAERGLRAVSLARQVQGWGTFGISALLCVLVAWLVRPAQQVRPPEVRAWIEAVDAAAGGAPEAAASPVQPPADKSAPRGKFPVRGGAAQAAGTGTPPGGTERPAAPSPESTRGAAEAASGPSSTGSSGEAAEDVGAGKGGDLAGQELDPEEPGSRTGDAVATLQQVPEDPFTARWVGPGLLAGGALLLLLALARRSANVVVTDSKSFRKTLVAWMPLLTRLHPTPRALKRFLNRLRYDAMRQGSSTDDEEGPLVAFFHGWMEAAAKGKSLYGRLKEALAWARRGGRPTLSPPPAGEVRIPDSWLVALSSAAEWEEVQGQDFVATLLNAPGVSVSATPPAPPPAPPTAPVNAGDAPSAAEPATASETLARNIAAAAPPSEEAAVPNAHEDPLNPAAHPERFSRETRETWAQTDFDPVDDPHAIITAFRKLRRENGPTEA